MSIRRRRSSASRSRRPAIRWRGGWHFYSIRLNDALNDYPKFGVWTDGIYMSANMFGFPAGGTLPGLRVWAFNKAQMYAGEPTVQVVEFRPGASDFTAAAQQRPPADRHPSAGHARTTSSPAGTSSTR